MPTFVYMTRCDGCGHCVDICPSDIMHIDPTYRRAYNIEPNMCWECFDAFLAVPTPQRADGLGRRRRLELHKDLSNLSHVRRGQRAVEVFGAVLRRATAGSNVGTARDHEVGGATNAGRPDRVALPERDGLN